MRNKQESVLPQSPALFFLAGWTNHRVGLLMFVVWFCMFLLMGIDGMVQNPVETATCVAFLFHFKCSVGS